MTASHYEPCIDCPPASRRQASLEALNETAQWIFATLREWHRRLHDRAELAALDDRTLRDIGLTRADAEYLINKPFWRK